MICYHGSDVIVSKPKILNSSRPLDFGGGFYVTSNKEQSKSWAKRVSLRNNSEKKYINSYMFDLDKCQSELKVIKFTNPDEEWLEFVCQNRVGKCDIEYDVVIGPVADDKVYRVVVEYESKNIDKETAIKRLKVEKLFDQILFHTADSLKYLKFVGYEEVSDE